MGGVVGGSVCLSVFLSVREHISEIARPNFTSFWHVTMAVARRHCDTLCTSCSVDEVTFFYSVLYGDMLLLRP